MKESHSHIGLAKICGWFGITRQAYYQQEWRMMDYSIESDLLIKEVHKIRESHKRMGGRKVYEKLQSFMLNHQIKMGRDAFFNLLAEHNLLVKRRKRKVHTTNSFHWLKKYPNLIVEFTPTGPNQLWVSDITYWKISDFFMYISLITDAYSHMIVGYHLADSLASLGPINALRMALFYLKGHDQKLIHHSDRGAQYCCVDYIRILTQNQIRISMTENGDPLENPIAERINGIVKEEYLLLENVTSKAHARKLLDKSIKLYNTDRPHLSIGNMTPSIVHSGKNKEPPERLWKNYYKYRLTQVDVK